MKLRARLAALTLILALTLSSSIVAAQGETVVYLQPAAQTIAVGEETSVEVWASNVTDFYGAQFTLTFDEAIVEGLDVGPGAAFTDFPDEYEVAQSEIVSGTVKFAATLLRVPKAGPFTGDVHLATITFKGLDAYYRFFNGE